MIRTSDLSYSYDKSSKLSFPNLSIEQGQHTLIIGKSGCGKTTLLHLLSGLRKADSGDIHIMEKQINGFSQAEMDKFRGKNVGMIFQVPHFIEALNVLENLTIAQSLAGVQMDKKKCLEFLKQLNIIQKANKKTSELSVGEQQRVAIARALINDPKIVFADEPTSALDDESTEQVIELLKEQADLHKATLIVVTHDQRLKDNFDNRVNL